MRRSRTGSPSTSTRTRLAVCLAAAAALAGGVAYRAIGRGGARPLAWRDLSARFAGWEFPQPAFRIYQRADTFAGFMRSEQPGVRPPSPGVDFHHEEVVVLAPGPRSSTGYGVRVLGVTGERHRIVVDALEVTPSLGEAVRPGVTYPFMVIALPRSGRTVTVHWQGNR